jgi:hypothetical protein
LISRRKSRLRASPLPATPIKYGIPRPDKFISRHNHVSGFLLKFGVLAMSERSYQITSDVDIVNDSVRRPSATRRCCRRHENSHPYESAPSAAAVIFNTPGHANQYDIGLLVATRYATNAQGYKEVHYPADSMLNDLFSLPTMNGDGTLGGGAGLSIDSFFTSISRRPLPIRQAFATNPARGPE